MKTGKMRLLRYGHLKWQKDDTVRNLGMTGSQMYPAYFSRLILMLQALLPARIRRSGFEMRKIFLSYPAVLT